MKHWINILMIASCVLILSIVGCELLTGIGIGVGASETAVYLEKNLEAKRIELNNLYDSKIAEMKATNDPNELIFIRKEVEQIQIAQIANMGASTVLSELKKKATDETPDSEKGYLNLLHGLIPIALAYAGSEINKRIKISKELVKSDAKRTAIKRGNELAMRELDAMDDKEITSAIVKEKMYRAVGEALRG